MKASPQTEEAASSPPKPAADGAGDPTSAPPHQPQQDTTYSKRRGRALTLHFAPAFFLSVWSIFLIVFQSPFSVLEIRLLILNNS